ncbi:MAG: radical SAM family heme chaperone HemW [Victivallales bacterium]|nr:radical SAM family heme chaperone HemW [Victivallales bacterium]
MFDNLYIHVPFCRSKCGYCAFYSLPDTDEELQDRYVAFLERQMNDYSFVESLQTIYFGGGTPSLLPPRLLERLFLAVNAGFRMASDVEITIECNPETIDRKKAALISAFANRISMGVQSFDPALRQRLGRRADNTDIEQALAMFNHYNARRLSIDLIYAIPGQTLTAWLAELQQAVDYGFRHISCYALTVEEGTVLAQESGIDVVDEELSAEMWWATGELLHRNGLSRYEVSNYAAPGQECRHNLNVWHGGSYLGLGPSACSFDGSRRWTQPADLAEWLAHHPAETDLLPPENRAREIFVFGLRTAAGWRQADWTRLLPEIRNAMPWETLTSRPELPELVRQGLLEMTPGHIRPTETGMAFWDNLAQALL